MHLDVDMLAVGGGGGAPGAACGAGAGEHAREREGDGAHRGDGDTGQAGGPVVVADRHELLAEVRPHEQHGADADRHREELDRRVKW